jgi:hypothetical protein
LNWITPGTRILEIATATLPDVFVDRTRLGFVKFQVPFFYGPTTAKVSALAARVVADLLGVKDVRYLTKLCSEKANASLEILLNKHRSRPARQDAVLPQARWVVEALQQELPAADVLDVITPIPQNVEASDLVKWLVEPAEDAKYVTAEA